ncbi:MAG TPA: C40 family peptidase [Pseudonocardia sp.]
MPHTDTVLPPALPAAVRRAALVAGSTAAAALLTLLPATPTGPGAPAPTAAAGTAVPTATATAGRAPDTATPVRLTAASRPAALPTPRAAAAPAAARGAALQRALGKVGAPYRYGAAGPSAFDCSGLVTWAYRSGGTSLPRSSRAMSQVGTAVPRSALQPGDLVFFYRPVSHVAIYIGNGKVVHASSSRKPVQISDIGRMPFTTARRV